MSVWGWQNLRQDSCAFAAPSLRVFGQGSWAWRSACELCLQVEYICICKKHFCVIVSASNLAFRSSRNAGSFCTPAHLKIFALTSPMYFSFLIHEVEMIVLICLPHKFVERINWCLYRVLEPYTNIKVILNRFFGITEPSNKRSWRLNCLHAYSNLGFQACSRCPAREVGFLGLPLSQLKDVHHARHLCFKIPFTAPFSWLLASLSACRLTSFQHFKELRKRSENSQLQDLFSVFLN